MIALVALLAAYLVVWLRLRRCVRIVTPYGHHMSPGCVLSGGAAGTWRVVAVPGPTELVVVPTKM